MTDIPQRERGRVTVALFVLSALVFWWALSW